MTSKDPSKPVYLILGATGGIGSALCRRLASRGSSLALIARDEDKLKALATELDGTETLVASLDVKGSDQVKSAVDQTIERFGRLDGAALLVGSILLKPAHMTSEKDWHETLATNLTPAFYLLRHASRAMFKAGGSIVLVSTAAARIGLANHEAIAAAKAGLQGLARSAAATYAGRGIRVNCVSPGLVDTPLAARIVGNEKALDASRAMHPLGRIGQPEDVASAIDFLLDPANSWITGQNLGLDGGLADLKVR